MPLHMRLEEMASKRKTVQKTVTKAKKMQTKTSSKSSKTVARDRRKAVRAPLKVQVDCRDVDVFVSSKIMNISKGGLYVKTRKPPPRDMPLQIEFRLPAGQEPVHATGSVVWVSPAASRGNALLPVGVGIHFDHIDRKDLKRIEEYIEESRHSDNF